MISIIVSCYIFLYNDKKEANMFEIQLITHDYTKLITSI
jgi:hypothetical protein